MHPQRRAHGRLFGVPATGRTFAYKQMHIIRVAEGKGVEHWAVRDDASLMRQPPADGLRSLLLDPDPGRVGDTTAASLLASRSLPGRPLSAKGLFVAI